MVHIFVHFSFHDFCPGNSTWCSTGTVQSRGSGSLCSGTGYVCVHDTVHNTMLGIIMIIACTVYTSVLIPYLLLSLSLSVAGGIPWLMVSELFLQEARPVAVAIATIVNWLANFTVGLSFPYILVSMGQARSHNHVSVIIITHTCSTANCVSLQPVGISHSIMHLPSTCGDITQYNASPFNLWGYHTV